MSERTGLLDLEVSLLEAVEGVTGPTGEPVATTRVLAAIEAAGLLGPRHGHALLADLAVPWRRHVPLLAPRGNWGSQQGDPAADARYTEVGLGEAGRLALSAERGEVGPVPFGLVDGSWWRGGLQPPYDPAAIIDALRSGDVTDLLPHPVSGGTIGGDLDALVAGRPARLVASSTVTFEPAVDQPVLPPRDASEDAEGGWWIDEGKSIRFPYGRTCSPGWLRQSTKDDRLVITHVPYGIHLDDVAQHLEQRAGREDGRTESHDPHDRPRGTQRQHPLGPVSEVVDETDRRGSRLVCRLRRDADVEQAREWILSTWPLTVPVDALLPAPLHHLVTGWDAGDGSGLAALEALLATRPG